MRLFLVLSLVLSLSASLSQSLTPSSYLTAADRQRLKAVFTSALAGQSEVDAAYAVLGWQLLKAEGAVPNAQSLCTKLDKGMKGNVGAVQWAARASKALQCKANVPAEAAKLIKSGLTSDSVSDLYAAVQAQTALGEKVDPAAALKALTAALKKDDSLSQLGHAFDLAALLDPKGSSAEAKAVFERVEDAVVQADEVDERMLQFEGGLSVTNLIVSGAYKLSTKLNKQPPISKQQAVQFSNYFLSRKSVQSAKGGFHLLEALTTLTSNPFHIPVAVTLASGAATVVSESTPKVQVKVSDLFGVDLGQMDVTVESAMRKSDGAVIMSKNKMSAAAGLYEVNMLSAKPGRGFYELKVNAVPAKADARLVGNTGAVLTVKALGGITITGAEIGIGDADQTTAPKMSALDHPKKLGKALEADHHHKVLIKFTLKDKASKEKVRVHQAFIRLFHATSGSEIIFVAEPDSTNVYKFDLDVSSKSKEFGARSGNYEVSLIVGDAVISNPINWHLADLNLSFPGSDSDAEAATGSNDAPKPEIRHLFRLPETRPAVAVSNLFTLLCLAPVLIMLACWFKLGVNVSNITVSLWTLGFHGGLGGIFALYYYFWLQLDMFTTVKYLMCVSVVTFICGNKVLVGIADRRKKSGE